MIGAAQRAPGGLGTLPVLLASTMGGSWIGHWVARRRVSKADAADRSVPESGAFWNPHGLSRHPILAVALLGAAWVLAESVGPDGVGTSFVAVVLGALVGTVLGGRWVADEPAMGRWPWVGAAVVQVGAGGALLRLGAGGVAGLAAAAGLVWWFAGRSGRREAELGGPLVLPAPGAPWLPVIGQAGAVVLSVMCVTILVPALDVTSQDLSKILSLGILGIVSLGWRLRDPGAPWFAVLSALLLLGAPTLAVALGWEPRLLAASAFVPLVGSVWPGVRRALPLFVALLACSVAVRGVDPQIVAAGAIVVVSACIVGVDSGVRRWVAVVGATVSLAGVAAMLLIDVVDPLSAGPAVDGAVPAWRRARGDGGRTLEAAVADRPGEGWVWSEGRILQVGPTVARREAFLAALPSALWPGSRPRVLRGDVIGVRAAASRSLASAVTVVAPSRSAARLAHLRFQWNAGLGADPAVRWDLHWPRSNGEETDVFFDAPRPDALGGLNGWSRRRVEQLHRLSAGGTTVVRLDLRELDPSCLSAALAHWARAWSAGWVFLDPDRGPFLSLLLRDDGRALGAKEMEAAWTRPAIRSAMVASGIDTPEALIDCVLLGPTELRALVLGEAPVGPEHFLPPSGLSPADSASFSPMAALAALTSAAPVEIDTTGLPPERATGWKDRLVSRGRMRRMNLELMDAVSRGEVAKAATIAGRLSHEGEGGALDLRAFIDPWMTRGGRAMDEGRLQDAEAEFLFAASMSPRDPAPTLSLAEVYRRTGRWEQAEQGFRWVMALSPTSLAAGLGLADALRALRRLSDAADILDGLETIHPGDYTLLVNLAFLHDELAIGSDQNVERRLGRSRALFQRAAALDPDRPQARAGLARLYWKAGDLDAALGEMDRALMISPEATYRAWRGLILYEAQRLTEAEAELQRALLQDPALLDALIALGGVQIDLGRVGQGKDTWERALGLSPNNALVKENLRLLEESALLKMRSNGAR